LPVNVRALANTYCPPFLRPAFNRIENSPIGYRLAKGMFWSALGSVASQALALVAAVFVARMLGKSIYGELGMVRSTVGLFGAFAGFGLGLTATKHVAEFRRSDPERAGRIIGLSGLVAVGTGGLMALALLLFAPYLATHTIAAPHLAGVLRIGALILFLGALNGAQCGALSGFEAFRTLARVNTLVGLISCPLLVCGVWFGGLTGVIWATVIGLGVSWLLNHLALREEARKHGVHPTLKHCGREWPILWKFSLPAVLSVVMLGPVTWACGALLVNRPGGYGEMGIYSVANQWYAMILFLPGLLGSVVLPVLSDQHGQGGQQQSIRKTLSLAIKTNLVVVLPLVVVGAIASPYIMRLYGAGFGSGWPTLVVVLATAGLLACQLPVGQVITASGRMWIGFAMNTGWALAFLGGTFLLVRYGAVGLATARGASYVLHATWTFGFAIWFLRSGRAKELKIGRAEG
jgi:O-antigen/teichoic acid export membrane protein